MALNVYISSSASYNDRSMAYDHNGDLPGEYAQDVVAWHLSYPEHLELAAKRAENGNRLNRLGMYAITRVAQRFTGDFGEALVTGAKLYIAITDTPNVGGDTVTTPTYEDYVGSRIAEATADSLDGIKDAKDFMLELYTRLWEMAMNAHELNSLVDRIGSSLVPDTQAVTIRMGAALMRSLHIDAARRLQNPPPVE